VLRGTLELGAAGTAMRVERGSLIALEANTIHTATALTDCAILLTITKP
jgi:quercetin dioxygenase-like cupin family protein